MAHAATIGSLADGLIRSVAGLTAEKDGRQFRQCKDAALKTFRSQHHARVNQFDVQSRLDGLQEKFFVLNNEPLAAALGVRLDELASKTSKWKPEILSLFLSLSDRPAEKTDVSAVERPSTLQPTSQLTWAEIIADDPLTEEGVWDDVVVESDFSDEGAQAFSDDSAVEPTTSTQASSPGDEDSAVFARTFIIPSDRSVLDDIRNVRQNISRAQSSDRRADAASNGEVVVSELQVIRETLLMLHGVPSSIFETNGRGLVQLKPKYSVTSISTSTFARIMHSFDKVGTQLCLLRQWAAGPRKDALSQRTQAAIQARLQAVSKTLSALEQRFITAVHDTVVSLIALLSEVLSIVEPLLLTGRVLLKGPFQRPSDVLDSLFHATCNLQSMGKDEASIYSAELFFECLQVYSRPIQTWVTQGALDDRDNIFFVVLNKDENDLGSLWHTHVDLRKRLDGTADAPFFMQHVAQRILQAGKGVMFLKRLGYDQDEPTSPALAIESKQVLTSMTDGLLPFSETFNVALHDWIAGLEIHRTTSIRNVLLSECGLGKTIQAIDHIFLSRDGARLQEFADSLFARIDGNKLWNDRFVLTEAAQDSFGSLACVDRDKVFARTLPASDPATEVQRAVRAIDRILIGYSIPWPLQNIIRENTPSICQQVLTRLLRVYRAEYVLTKKEWMLSLSSDHSHDPDMSQTLALRQRLLWFVGTLRAHFTEISALSMRHLVLTIERAPDVDGLARAYADFQRILADKLLLTRSLRPISQALLAILDVCEDYAFVWVDMIEKAVTKSGRSTSRDLAARRQDSSAHSVTSQEALAGLYEEEKVEASPSMHRPSLEVNSLRAEYDRQLLFAIAGLRGVSRAGGESAWIMLAERLQLGAEPLDKR
ncbi:hypothetical protein MBLNU459_g1528t1 [Dothideomycetes sp. NU459]